MGDPSFLGSGISHAHLNFLLRTNRKRPIETVASYKAIRPTSPLFSSSFPARSQGLLWTNLSPSPPPPSTFKNSPHAGTTIRRNGVPSIISLPYCISSRRTKKMPPHVAQNKEEEEAGGKRDTQSLIGERRFKKRTRKCRLSRSFLPLCTLLGIVRTFDGSLSLSNLAFLTLRT